jgi:hypothetical protein
MSKEIKDWTDAEVEKIFDYHLDEMHPLDRLSVRNKITTVKGKREFLIKVEEKFKNSFK